MLARNLVVAGVLGNALAISPTFSYGSEKVRGVNLGGWLVLEPWITPSLFESTGNDAVVDEWTFGALQERNTALSALQRHWDTFITEDDFTNIAAAGLNHVRLPVGYWAWDVQYEPYIQGQLPYVRKAVSWARNHGLKLIIDLHGAPGSQNGYDNSGHRLSMPRWNANQTNIDRTNNVIKEIMSEFVGDVDTVSIVAPLNEPAGYYSQDLLSKTRQYWLDSYGNIRYPYGTSQQSNTVELIHDAFQPLSYWAGFVTSPSFEGVAIDTHRYQIFSDAEEARTQQQHIDFACQTGQEIASFHDNWVIVGEWTTAMTDCAKYLNGRGRGARYDGSYSGERAVGSCQGMTGSASGFSGDFKTFLRKMFEAQTAAFEMGIGWIMWTWKAENADEWSYQAGLKNGWIPQNPTNRQYPNICG